MGKSKEYDVIVVGSGAGGLTVAREMTKRGKSVLILERGGRVDSVGNLFALPKMLLKNGNTPSKEGYAVCFANTYGGASNIAAGAAIPAPASMFVPFGIDLTEETKEAKKDMWIQVMPDNLVGKGTLRIMEAANDLGYSWGKVENFIDPSRCIENCSDCMMGCARGAKWTARVYGDEAIKAGAELKLNKKIDRVIVENGTAVGVETTGKEKYFAKQVVLSGGAGNVFILRNSGLPEVGKGFCCDWLCFVAAVIPGMNTIHDNPMTVGSTEFYDTDDLILVPVFQHWSLYAFTLLTMGPQYLPRFFRHGKTSGIMVKIKDETTGELYAESSFSKPITKIEQKKLDKGIDIIKKIFKKAGAKEDTIFPLKPNGAHPSAVCRIGEVVDSNLETMKIKNLYCCDASVFPSALGLPTVWTIVSLGKRLAKHLDKRLNP